MCFQLRDALRVGCIGMSNHFFSISMEKRDILKTMDDELRNFSILVEAPKTPCVQLMLPTGFHLCQPKLHTASQVWKRCVGWSICTQAPPHTQRSRQIYAIQF